MTDSDSYPDEPSAPDSRSAPDWNATERDVLEALREILESDERGVLATVVDVEGSAYRRPGTRMVVPESGAAVGHVTAGCLENEIRRLSRDVLESGGARLETFDLTGSDETWGPGTGCSGVVTVRFEPIGDGHRPIADAVAAGNDLAISTVLDGEHAGARAYYERPTDGGGGNRDRAATGGHADEDAPNRLRADDGVPDAVVDALPDLADALVAREGSRRTRIDGNDTFVDTIRAPPTLLVVGTGHDLRPIVGLGDRLGYEVVVVGYRGARATDDRFPAANRVVSTSPTDVREAVALDERTFAVVATHNFVDDRLSVAELLESPVPYVGVVGPRKRFAEMREALEAEGRSLSPADLERCYSPVGLDLGGESPREIALSVVSEVQAVRNGREPTHLSDRPGPIHERGDGLE